jgi:hypothetical protein
MRQVRLSCQFSAEYDEALAADGLVGLGERASRDNEHIRAA